MQRLKYIPPRDTSDWDPVREYPEDVARLLHILERAGFAVSSEDVAAAYRDYSSSLCAGWIHLDDSDDRLLEFLLAYLSPPVPTPN